ncbi:MAG: hypothetical protein ACK5HP_02375 [Bacilli bacterium]
MSSRMERYYERNSEQPGRRSKKNENLYKEIYEIGEYSNIEGIAKIDKTNEVDINKIRQMLKNRENINYLENNRFEPQKEIKQLKKIEEEDKNYDIRDILTKAKINNPTKSEYHNLKNTNFDILKDLREKRKKETEINTEEDLKGLINTITSTSILNKMGDRELGLELFEELKSNNDTIIESRDSIKSILDQVKAEDKRRDKKNSEMDKSFFTSSSTFDEEDFEELAKLNKTIKKNNGLIIILSVIISLVLIVGILFL